jgi:acetyl esterase/lipase
MKQTHFSEFPYVTIPHERQKLDLYLPGSELQTPLIIWIHGGAFMGGSKEDEGIPLENLEHGFAIASINYRLSQHAIFPAQVQDCKAAVRWLRAHSLEYNLDADRFIAWGPSAGGHLASFLGTTGGYSKFDVGENLVFSSAVQGVVDYFGPTDFLQMDDHRTSDGMIHNIPDSPESRLVGGWIQEHPEAVRQANPISYVSARCPPFLIVHGDCDPLVPYHQSVLLASALKKEGVPVTFFTVHGGGHGGFTDPEVAELTQRFLMTYA